MDEVGVTEVVETVITEDGGANLEPGSLTEVNNSVALEELGDNASESTKHSPASVDDLDLAVAGESLGVGRHTGGIPAVVTGVLSLEVRGDVALREGAQELGAVCKRKENKSEYLQDKIILRARLARREGSMQRGKYSGYYSPAP